MSQSCETDHRRRASLAEITTFVEAVVDDGLRPPFDPVARRVLVCRYQPLLFSESYQGHPLSNYFRHQKNVKVSDGLLYQVKSENRQKIIHNFLCRFFLCEVAGLITEFLYTYE